MKVAFSKRIFEKFSNIKFHGNVSSGSRVVPCGQMYGRTDGRTDMMKRTVAFRNVANAPINVVAARNFRGSKLKDNYLPVIKLSLKRVWNFMEIIRLCN
jgi:hypothetical protein